MKNLIFLVCLSLTLAGYINPRDWIHHLLGQAADAPMTALLTDWLPKDSATLAFTQPGQEKLLAERVHKTLRQFAATDSLGGARVRLKQVRFITATPQPMFDGESNETRGHYFVTLSYDVLQPLTHQAGTALVSAICQQGVGQVRLNDGFGVLKLFKCAPE